MWIAFVAAMEVLPQAIDAQLRSDAGLTSFEYMILVRLSEEPHGVVPMADLKLFVAGSLSRLSHALSRLERDGLVERRPGSGGNRVEVHLLPAGRERIEQAAPGHVAKVRELVLDPLSPTQIGQLGRICRALLEASAPEVGRAVDAAVERTSTPE